jgi:hypothetical protein
MNKRVVSYSVVAVTLMLLGARADDSLDVAVNARVFNGYQRTVLADGTFKPERFGVAEGGRWNGTAVDRTIDGLKFSDILQRIVQPLQRQRYIPTSDPKETDLLILVFWGTTNGAGDMQYEQGQRAIFDVVADAQIAAAAAGPQSMSGGFHVQPAGTALDAALSALSMANSERDRNNVSNAAILGYTDAYVHARDLREMGLAAGDETVNELEASRYFVVLKAYDFRTATKEKKLKLLWESRFSIYAHGHQFDRQLLAMTQAASKYFGQTTKGIVHRDTPTANVDVGPLRVIEPEGGGAAERPTLNIQRPKSK